MPHFRGIAPYLTIARCDVGTSTVARHDVGTKHRAIIDSCAV
ncbi:MAG: hypothetical protein Q7S52_00060 [bacterium]|nr:hypothetical protein [bacterium]